MKQTFQTVQDLKTEVETIKKTQTERILEMENLGKRTGATESRIVNRIPELQSQG